MKRFKKTLISIMSVVLVIAMTGTCCVFADKEPGNKTITIPMNVDLMDQLLPEKPFRGNGGVLSYSFSDDKSQMFLSIQIDGNDDYYVLYGSCVEEETDEYTALVGYYEGCSESRSGMLSKEDRVLDVVISADITIIENDSFVVVTLYQSNLDTSVFFFGERTSKIIDYSKKQYQKSLQNELEVYDAEETNMYRDPGATQFRGSVNVSMGNRKVGEISAFHSAQLLNQGSMTVYEKINANSAGVNAYVQTDLGYGYNYAYTTIDQVVLSMRGNVSPLHAIANTYSPTAGSTSFNLIIPYYGGQHIGFGTISIPITTSSTSIATSSYPDSTHPNNKVEWTMYKSVGFGLTGLDGDSTTETGLSSNATYLYEGLVSSNTTKSMRFTGSIRFKYCIFNANDIIYAHFTTPTFQFTTYVTIIPHN